MEKVYEICLRISEFCASDLGWTVCAFLVGALAVMIVWWVRHPEDFVERVEEESEEACNEDHAV